MIRVEDRPCVDDKHEVVIEDWMHCVDTSVNMTYVYDNGNASGGGRSDFKRFQPTGGTGYSVPTWPVFEPPGASAALHNTAHHFRYVFMEAVFCLLLCVPGIHYCLRQWTEMSTAMCANANVFGRQWTTNDQRSQGKHLSFSSYH